MKAALYLLPVNLSEAPINDVLPALNFKLAAQIRHFIVENVRTARRFLKKCDPSIDIDALTFHELNNHTDLTEVGLFLDPLRRGEAVGLMSEAGCPGVADPGAVVVGIAQREGLEVIPLTGPSSILLGLMASGFNGQGFSFNGYLPIDSHKRTARLRELERWAYTDDATQIFIETPYRNDTMLATLCSTLKPETLLCVAADITDPDSQFIRTAPISKWKRSGTVIGKRPAIFLIYHP